MPLLISYPAMSWSEARQPYPVIVLLKNGAKSNWRFPNIKGQHADTEGKPNGTTILANVVT